jgi:hypothetical protein
MAWFKREGEANSEDNFGEFKPGEFKDELGKDIDTKLAGKFEEFSTKQQEALKPMMDFFGEIKADRDKRKAAEEEAARRKTEENNELKDEDFLLDPAAAVKKMMSPTNRAIVQLAARTIKTDTLADKEYYYGDIKSKVDEMIAKEPLENQTNPAVIENCYKLVMFDHQQDIIDGKIKKRNTGPIFESFGAGGHGGKSGEESEMTLSEDEKRAAKMFGMTESEWNKNKKEIGYVD